MGWTDGGRLARLPQIEALSGPGRSQRDVEAHCGGLGQFVAGQAIDGDRHPQTGAPPAIHDPQAVRAVVRGDEQVRQDRLCFRIVPSAARRGQETIQAEGDADCGLCRAKGADEVVITSAAADGKAHAGDQYLEGDAGVVAQVVDLGQVEIDDIGNAIGFEDIVDPAQILQRRVHGVVETEPVRLGDDGVRIAAAELRELLDGVPLLGLQRRGAQKVGEIGFAVAIDRPLEVGGLFRRQLEFLQQAVEVLDLTEDQPEIIDTGATDGLDGERDDLGVGLRRACAD